MFDIWRSGFVRRALRSVADTAGVKAEEVTWLPAGGPFQFVADPFGIEREGVVTVFVEAFDYRVRRGEIHFYQYDAANTLIGQGVALAEPFHLSYPSLIEEHGELYMLPEGYKSGRLTLYRCVRFPDRWEPVQRLGDLAAIDATVVRHDERWWMFYALAGSQDRAMRELHVAWADSLMGPWTPHAANPVRSGFESSRPGGTAFEHRDALHLPVQNCATTYGAAINLLRIDTLTPDAFDATVVQRFEPGDLLAGHNDGLHTLSGLGDLTFIDVKRVCHSSAERWVKTQYKVRRLLGLNGPRARRRPDAPATPASETVASFIATRREPELMRVAVVMPRGGTMCRRSANSMETVAYTLREHSRLKPQVRIICDAGAAAPLIDDLITVPARLGKARRANAVAEALRALDPDYVEYHQQLESAASLAKRFPDKIHVLYRHTRIKPPRDPIGRLRYEARLKAFDRLVFVSEAACAEFLADYPAFAGRVSAICNPIDSAAWHGDPGRRDQLILFSGRAIKEKGLEPFCAALATVLDQAPDWRGALMLGDWERHRVWAEPVIQSLDRFGDRVEIHKSAPLADVTAMTKRAAIAVSPSFVAEALGLTALEAHAAGAALISSGRGGLREASGPHAIYVDPPEADGLTLAMFQLVRDAPMRTRMAERGQVRVAHVHSAERRSDQLDDLRESLMAQPRPDRLARSPGLVGIIQALFRTGRSQGSRGGPSAGPIDTPGENVGRARLSDRRRVRAWADERFSPG